MSSGTTIGREGAATGKPPASMRRLLQVLLALTILSTVVHYSHNYLEAESYPPVPLFFPTPLSYRIGILVFWPLLTALALWGYAQFVDGRWGRARVALILYSPLAITSVGHFLGGVPQIPAFFFATMFTDLLTGLAVLAFAIWGVRRSAELAVPAPARVGGAQP